MPQSASSPEPQSAAAGIAGAMANITDWTSFHPQSFTSHLAWPVSWTTAVCISQNVTADCVSSLRGGGGWHLLHQEDQKREMASIENSSQKYPMKRGKLAEDRRDKCIYIKAKCSFFNGPIFFFLCLNSQCSILRYPKWELSSIFLYFLSVLIPFDVQILVFPMFPTVNSPESQTVPTQNYLL